MEVSLSAHVLGWKYFVSLQDGSDEPIHKSNDKYIRHFVRQSIKGGRVCAFNHHFKSKNSDEVLKIVSKE